VEKSSVVVRDMSDVEDRVRAIEKDVKRILVNDLPHISAKLSSLSANQKWLTAICLLLLGAVFAGLVQTTFFK